jgi:capsular polysaccharide transport system ATP-binding protein
LIQIEDVTKVYPTRQGPRVVLDTINLRVEKGQRVGIIGRNGAGKSTLIRLIGGVEPPTRGRIRRGMSVSWPLAFSGGFHPNLTGLDNLQFICRIYDHDYKKVLPFVEEFTELGAYLREPVLHYSAGMRARLAFALSMAIEFDCFLIDEIISVGDSRFHEKCHIELFEKRKDRALIIVSHNLDTIKSHCDSASVLVDGKLQSFGHVDEAFSYYQSRVH